MQKGAHERSWERTATTLTVLSLAGMVLLGCASPLAAFVARASTEAILMLITAGLLVATLGCLAGLVVAILAYRKGQPGALLVSALTFEFVLFMDLVFVGTVYFVGMAAGMRIGGFH